MLHFQSNLPSPGGSDGIPRSDSSGSSIKCFSLSCLQTRMQQMFIHLKFHSLRILSNYFFTMLALKFRQHVIITPQIFASDKVKLFTEEWIIGRKDVNHDGTCFGSFVSHHVDHVSCFVCPEFAGCASGCFILSITYYTLAQKFFQQLV